jgi:hypothetical protein
MASPMHVQRAEEGLSILIVLPDTRRIVGIVSYIEAS